MHTDHAVSFDLDEIDDLDFLHDSCCEKPSPLNGYLVVSNIVLSLVILIIFLIGWGII